MRAKLTFIITLFSILITYGQSPQKISYQAVIRTLDNQIISNTQISMRISILKDSVNGAVVYSESHSPITNSSGILSLQIGTGNILLGEMATINWSSGIYFIKTETDLNGGENYELNGISQILSVPYSLYSEKSGDSSSIKSLIYTSSSF